MSWKLTPFFMPKVGKSTCQRRNGGSIRLEHRIDSRCRLMYFEEECFFLFSEKAYSSVSKWKHKRVSFYFRIYQKPTRIVDACGKTGKSYYHPVVPKQKRTRLQVLLALFVKSFYSMWLITGRELFPSCSSSMVEFWWWFPMIKYLISAKRT